MCIAIANLKGMPLSRAHFMNAWDNNSHGGGLCYVEGGVLKLHHELTDKEALYAIYSDKVRKSNVLLHMRITSKGSKTLDNCHPFPVTPDLALIHNGTIMNSKLTIEGQESDTSAFASLLGNMPPDFLEYPDLVSLLENFIGSSKIALMDSSGNFHFLNKNGPSAFVDKTTGNWFSNRSHERVNNYVWQGNKKVYKQGYSAPVSTYKKPSYENTKTQPIYRQVGKSPLVFPGTEEKFSWLDDFANNKLTVGFEKTMLEIIQAGKYTRKFKDFDMVLNSLIAFRGNAYSIKYAMKRVFNDWCYDDSKEEMQSAWKYFVTVWEELNENKWVKK